MMNSNHEMVDQGTNNCPDMRENQRNPKPAIGGSEGFPPSRNVTEYPGRHIAGRIYSRASIQSKTKNKLLCQNYRLMNFH